MFPCKLLTRAGTALAAAILLVAGGLAAEGAAPGAPSRLPDWAVLVLQPVGDKRVRPVTGAVVSERTVIVPADFAAPGDVLIVLDGGSDIFEHGRSATVRVHDPVAGIAVLDVPGLARRPARLAAGAAPVEAIVHLAAFPPAEQIAQGDAALWLPARVGDLAFVRPGDGSPDRAAGGPAGGPLPNVSGPLIDRCGLLAGYSLAAGLPAMEPSATTVYAWGESLLPVLRAAGIGFNVAACSPGEVQAPLESGEALAGGGDPAPQAFERSTVKGDGTPVPERTQTADTATPYRIWIAAALAMLAAAFAAWRLRRWRPRPVPGLLQDRIAGRILHRKVADAPTGERPRAAASGWILELHGTLPSGAAFTRQCPVNPVAIDVVIGSGEADIRLDAPGVGREHVRIAGRVGAMTVSDLGSPGGTWIGRVPCARGEILFLTGADTVFLADTSFRARLVAPDGSDAAEAVETP